MDDKVKEALEAVVKEAPSTGYNEYARAYAEAALNHPFGVNRVMEGEELRVQLLYILNNLQYWKGERAREVKAVLKKASQQ